MAAHRNPTDVLSEGLMTNRTSALLVSLALAAASPAWAQDAPDAPAEPAEPAPEQFSLDPVFVSRFEPEDPAVLDVSKHVRELLETRLRAQFILIERAEVPAFEDYSSETYLDSCPPAQFFGCAFVIGSRAQAEWVVTGQVSPSEELEGGPPSINVVFIDVNDSRVVFSFSASLAPDSEAAFADGVADVLDKIVQGAAVEKDIRDEDPRAKAERERLNREALAQSLSDMEGELGALAANVPMEQLRDPKLTAEDLAQFAGGEEATPWDRIGLSQTQYLRFRNSGKTLADWNHLSRGRAARIIVSAGVGGVSGPWSQFFDGRRGLDRSTLQPLQIREYQHVTHGGGLSTDLEVAVGVHKWIEVGFDATLRSTLYKYRFLSQVQDQDVVVPDINDHSLTTWQIGGRVSFVPMATWPFRPTGTVGIGWWQGTAIQHISQMPTGIEPLDAPTQLFLEIGPGVEVDLGDTITIYGKVMLDQQFAGDQLQAVETGPAILTELYTPDPADWRAPGFQITAGVRVRLGPLFTPKSRAAPTLDEDEP
jgi:hypothetical protein